MIAGEYLKRKRKSGIFVYVLFLSHFIILKNHIKYYKTEKKE